MVPPVMPVGALGLPRMERIVPAVVKGTKDRDFNCEAQEAGDDCQVVFTCPALEQC
jgi:hypothetical protein